MSLQHSRVLVWASLLLLVAGVSSACLSYSDDEASAEPDVQSPEDVEGSPDQDTSTEAPDAEVDVETPPDSDPTGGGVYGLASCEDATALEGGYGPVGCGFFVEYDRAKRDILPSCGQVSGEASAAPQHLHIAFGSADASRDMSFLWYTDADTRVSEVRYGTSPESLDSVAYGVSFSYRDLLRVNPRVVHEVRICGLQPGTTYYYQAGGEGAWSPVHTFTTGLPVGSTQPYRFAVSGDTRNPTNEPWRDALEAIEAQGVAFHIFSGDAVDVGGVQAQWDSWFDAAYPVLASQPFMPANGNHELFALNYKAAFALPGDGENYYFRYGNGLFILVNDLPLPDYQAGVSGPVREFLETTLREHADATWKVIVHHRPMYSASTRHGSDFFLRETWAPVLDRYGVDFVFAGHDHNYERSAPMRNDQVVRDGEGTVYVVAAGIGAPLYNNGTQAWTAFSAKVSSFVIVDVSENTFHMRAYRTDGTLLDEYRLTK